MPNELKPCPFCGEIPKFIPYSKGWCVECRANPCLILPETAICETKEKAAEEWNRRANDEQAEFANRLYNNCYRKSTDAAREIFEGIERALNLSKCYGDSGIYFEKDIETDIAELKKKYESEGADDE